LQLHERGLKKLKKRITKQAVRRKACGKPGVFQQPRLVSPTMLCDPAQRFKMADTAVTLAVSERDLYGTARGA
jgi:hypothetical protein